MARIIEIKSNDIFKTTKFLKDKASFKSRKSNCNPYITKPNWVNQIFQNIQEWNSFWESTKTKIKLLFFKWSLTLMNYHEQN